ncbi:MAG: hypothetical protein K9H26_13180 [Prolixibacteraceae bacterium]|nr:hypothetical protein [Prolixibacteraceae bacterium]
MHKIFILFIIFAACFFRAYSMSYYVNSVLGNDANPGTGPNIPWQTLNPVNAGNFLPGDTIYFACGSEWNQALNIASNGVKGNPVVYKSYANGNKPLISTPSPVKHDFDFYKSLKQYEELSIPAVQITGKWNIFEGFFVRDAPFAAIELSKGADHNIVRNCEISNSGLGVSAYSMYNLLMFRRCVKY